MHSYNRYATQADDWLNNNNNCALAWLTFCLLVACLIPPFVVLGYEWRCEALKERSRDACRTSFAHTPQKRNGCIVPVSMSVLIWIRYCYVRHFLFQRVINVILERLQHSWLSDTQQRQPAAGGRLYQKILLRVLSLHTEASLADWMRGQNL